MAPHEQAVFIVADDGVDIYGRALVVADLEIMKWRSA
jgi:hypothetical protein